MRRTLTAIAFVLTFLLGCLPVQVSGASEPTEHTFMLTEADLAYVESDTCRQDWVTGSPATDLETAETMLDERGVRIKPGNPVATATALARTLRVSKDYEKRDTAGKAILLSHELVHYCQRDEQGHTAFEESYFASAGRWRAEVPAYLQSFRTMLLQCMPIPVVEAAIEKRIMTMRDTYLLWDIEPTQYETETRRIWRSVLDVPEHCVAAANDAGQAEAA